MNAVVNFNQRTVKRWSRLIDEILDAGASHERIESESGMLKHTVDEIANGRQPRKHEQEQLNFIACKWVPIERLLTVGFDFVEIDDMCLLTSCTETEAVRVRDPVRVFSTMP
ncbi:MAG: hypothetical protein ACI9XK_003389 [Granulosicoccus sp.]|jgi:hypothetical protein